MDINIFLIHGFCGNILQFYPLKWTLNKRGYKNIHILNYPSTKVNLIEATEIINNQINNIIKKSNNKKIILISHSFGGIISYNLIDTFEISLLILIASPIKKCSILNKITSVLPNKLNNLILNTIPALQDLKDLQNLHIDNNKININIPYFTITTNLFYTNSFDGLIYLQDAIIDLDKNINITNSSHNLLLFNKKFLKTIGNLLDSHFINLNVVENNIVKIDYNNNI